MRTVRFACMLVMAQFLGIVGPCFPEGQGLSSISDLAAFYMAIQLAAWKSYPQKYCSWPMQASMSRTLNVTLDTSTLPWSSKDTWLDSDLNGHSPAHDRDLKGHIALGEWTESVSQAPLCDVRAGCNLLRADIGLHEGPWFHTRHRRILLNQWPGI